MSREEAIVVLKCIMPNSSIRCVASDDEKEEAITMAIEALKREENPNSIRINFVGEKEAKEFDKYLKNQQPKESVLDKIKTEIKAMFPPSGSWMHEEGHEVEHTVCEVLSDVLQIIDKYKESEDKK